MDNKELIVVEEEETSLLETNSEKYQEIETSLTEIQRKLSDASDKIAIKIPEYIELLHSSTFNPKYAEAFAKFIQAFSNLNRDTLEVVKQKQNLYDSFRKKEGKTEVTDNRSINFHGTSSEILDKILNK